MKVKQLIGKLSECNPEAEVKISYVEIDEDGEEYTIETDVFVYECSLTNTVWINED